MHSYDDELEFLDERVGADLRERTEAPPLLEVIFFLLNWIKVFTNF